MSWREHRPRQVVVGASIDVIYGRGAVAKLLRWAALRESRYVCACNVHSVVTAQSNGRLAQAVRDADMALPDGAPVAWLMRMSGYTAQRRVSGPDLMWRYFAAAAPYRESIFLLGGTEETLRRLQERIEQTFPGLQVSGTCSPPFRELSVAEDAAIVDLVNASEASTVWVSFGCPKQEIWMSEHRDRIRSVMIGVGAAFKFHSGEVARAPGWMQRLSLEWAHRLFTDPRRLWKRYLVTNVLFIAAAVRQIAARRSS